MEQDEKVNWISRVIIPRILKHKEFHGLLLQKTEICANEIHKDNWASSIFEIHLHSHRQHNKKSFSVLLKLMDEKEEVRKHLSSEKQFFNEIHLYSVVIPFFVSEVLSLKLKNDFENLFPKCYYSYYKKNKVPLTTEDAIVAMEDLKMNNYKLGNRISLDLKHCVLAMKRLGVFHAFSYFIKEKHPDKFMNLVVQPIQETFYGFADKDITNKLFEVSQQRIIDVLAQELPDDDPKLVRLRSIADRGAFDLFIDLVQPREPLSVLCHGDFLRNNVLFRYVNDEPVDMKLIDFQTVRYASPAIDLSLFICMNTTHALRTAHFDELLHAYHHSLVETLVSLLGKTEDQLSECYSFESFLADFRRHALYGYLISIEFLAWMLGDEDELALISKLNFEERGSPRYNEVLRHLGGENVTSVLVQLTNDLIVQQCL